MRIAINKCYGGFGLSPTALKLLIKYNYEHISKTPIKEWYSYGRNSDREYTDVGDGFCVDFCASYLINREEMMIYSFDLVRADPILLRVIDELGEKANGKYAEIEIVDIPDDIQYSIDEYDGIESVHENHRSW